MKSLYSQWFFVALWITGLTFGVSKPVYAKADYPLILIGGGLAFCTSETPRDCVKPIKTEADDHVDYAYLITPQRITELKNSQWLATRQNHKQQMVAAVEMAKSRTQGVLTRRQLLTALRDVEINFKGRKVSGLDILSALDDTEFHLVMDILQKENVEHNFLSADSHKSVKVDLKNSKSHFSQKVLREFILQSRSAAGNKEPNILLVTSASRDQFKSVDLYTQVLTTLGAKVTWLPIELALFAAIDENKATPEVNACEHIETYRQQLQQVYARNRIFPRLTAIQQRFCETPESLDQLIHSAHGIYFTDGDADRLYRTFVNSYSQSQKLLTSIHTRMLAEELVVAADQGAAMALSGGESSFSKPVMMLEGKSHHALKFGSFLTTKPLSHCEKQQACPNNYHDDQVTYMPTGIGLFPFGVIDTQFSERGRQGRLVRLISQTDSNFGYGIDERTALLVGIDTESDIPLKMEVMGENGVSIFDTTEVEQDKGFKNAILSVRSHYVTDEDKLFFRNNKLIISFADWKYSGNSRSRPVIKSGGAFKKDNYRRTIYMLCVTGADAATMKHAVLGEGHTLYVTKSRTSISLAGQRNVAGKNYNFCSYRDYYLDINAI